MNRKPIGIFDSGVGGLTVLKELVINLPNEDFVYFGDTKRAPYGSRSREEIIKFSMDIVRFLEKQDVKAFIIACNTIDSIVSDYIREATDIPVLGVISSGVEMAANATNNKRVGLIATKGTVDSDVYRRKIEESGEINLISKAIPKFVEIVENNKMENLEKDIDDNLKSFKSTDIDTLILGCTHFPVIENDINIYFKGGIKLIDPAILLSERVQELFGKEKVSEKGSVKYYITGDVDKFKEIGFNILGKRLENVSQVGL